MEIAFKILNENKDSFSLLLSHNESKLPIPPRLD